ncbi:amino acid transmembrane transporter [Aureococcus anophagefferens]|nr:amino acid transmembrane transporter [Aureococcus anophagefferens]
MSKRWWQEESAAEAGFDFETANDGGDDDDADYVKTGPYIGRAVRRTFGRGVVSYGVVVSWLPHEKNEGQAFFRVRHDDGDEEDLDEAEVDAPPPTPAHPRRRPATPATTRPPTPRRGRRSATATSRQRRQRRRAAFGDAADDAPRRGRRGARGLLEGPRRWKGAHEAALDVAQIEPVEVCDLLAGVVAVARAGARTSLKMECKAVADRVPVGADEAEVWAWLDPLRPYAPYEAMGWEDWLDQLTLRRHAVAVASNDCARLPPSLLPAEYALVADPATLRRCVKKRDVHLVGDVATCLRVFGAADDDARVVVARDFLVKAQIRDGVEAGSWPTRDGDATSYAAYHAARHVAKIADRYREENADVDAAARNFDLEERAARRLAGLLKWKRAMEARTIDDDDEGDERARKKRNKQRLR